MVLAIVFSSCGAPILLVAKPVEMVTIGVARNLEHRKGPAPEAEWNSLGIWYRISNHPPTYLPKGYARSLPQNERSGQWVVDQRDGKRLFVPKGGVRDFPEGALLGDAKNATNWKHRDRMKVTPRSLIVGVEPD